MDANRLDELINLLTSKTREGVLEWKSTTMAVGNAFECKIAGLRISLTRLVSASRLGSTRIAIRDETGTEVVNVGEGEFVSSGTSGLSGLMGVMRPVRIGAELGALYDLVQASGNKSSRALEKIISELNSLGK
jgi:hypothetical protein